MTYNHLQLPIDRRDATKQAETLLAPSKRAVNNDTEPPEPTPPLSTDVESLVSSTTEISDLVQTRDSSLPNVGEQPAFQLYSSLEQSEVLRNREKPNQAPVLRSSQDPFRTPSTRSGRSSPTPRTPPSEAEGGNQAAGGNDEGQATAFDELQAHLPTYNNQLEAAQQDERPVRPPENPDRSLTLPLVRSPVEEIQPVARDTNEIDGPERPIQHQGTTASREDSERAAKISSLQSLVTQADVKTRAVTTDSEVSKSKHSLARSKALFAASQLSINFFFIFATWYWSQYYYIYLPFITVTVALNCFMIFSVLAHKILRFVLPEKKYVPDQPENLVFVLPCYNETREECTRSLDSLVDQINIEKHKRAIMIVCDGRAKGQGMEKTCADYLLEDILVEKTDHQVISGAYTAWNTEPNDITMQKGTYKGVPYLCLVKNRNLGKRDGLILIRSFLYIFNTRRQKPRCIFSPTFFAEMAYFLENDAAIENVDILIGMDADTVFADDCVENLLEESRYKHTVGVCGYVAVDFSSGNWDLWSLYQSTEYTISQALRRLHQSIATHKVSCLPGCCQLLRICEATCGDEVLLELFGYFPYASDGMLKQIRATASEDRNHVCLMLSARPKSQTRQALRARAFTDVPHSWSVFLSQRRRWTLGATSNDLLLVFARGVNWFERILAAANVLTWYLNPFILASIASFIVACLHVKYWIILSFASVMIAPLLYYVCIAIWLPRGFRPRIQYLLGLATYVFLGPFLNIAVLVYALWNMDNFGWGKTRKVVDDVGTSEKKDGNTSRGAPGDQDQSTAAPSTTMTQVQRPQPVRVRGDYDEERVLR